MLKTTQVIALAAMICGAVAYADTPAPELSLEQQLAQKHFKLLKPVQFIQKYSTMGWLMLDNQHIIIQSTPARSYLVTLRRPCHKLDQTQISIAFSTSPGVTDTVTRSDEVLVKDRANNFVEHCRIDQLHELEENMGSE